ncbi:hypothetical protein B586_20095 [Mycobacterium haemophilum DSM 44634]|uniref:hypothetical protein n=1 Tax=Mycobacterium haemophilum TaxID=29311 RepID=UPI0006D46240|nr:hypothetical protein [Mycobacterium haemophilum]ALL56288.1 hypothetical protein B586_20095 [Mycobacterium haemophilum DSM 44634]MCV7340191.1 hypothetical protein [Mycobacterium haemophilum DSM 44634]
MATSKKDAAAASKALRTGRRNKRIAASALLQAQRGAKKMPAKTVRSGGPVRRPVARETPATMKPPMPTMPQGRGHVGDERPRPESVDEKTIARLVAEAENGIPAEKLRRRGRPAIGDEAASTYSVRLPDDLVTLADERSEIDSVTRGETIRRALIEYLTK